MKKRYSIIDHDGRLLSRLAIKPIAGGNELDVEFDRDFTQALSSKTITQAREIRQSLGEIFPSNQFAVVQITLRRGKYFVDLPVGERQSWISKAVESIGGVFIA